VPNPLKVDDSLVAEEFADHGNFIYGVNYNATTMKIINGSQNYVECYRECQKYNGESIHVPSTEWVSARALTFKIEISPARNKLTPTDHMWKLVHVH